MLTAFCRSQRYLQTNLPNFTSGLPISSLASFGSMPLTATSILDHAAKSQLSSLLPRSTRDPCSIPQNSETTQRRGQRRHCSRVSALPEEKSKVQAKELCTEKLRTDSPAAPRRAKHASKAVSDAKLTDIRGVGPKNAKLLADAGYADIRAVRQCYLNDCSEDQQRFRQHLQSKVGIKLNMHQEMIAKFIQESSDMAREKSDSAMEPGQQGAENIRQRNNVTLSVEGNISAGKSTFLKGITDHCPDLQSLMHVAPEPVDRWQKVNASNGNSYNLLDEFYHDKKRFAYIFQNYIFFTRMMQEKESGSAMTSQPYRLLERSIFCDRMVFVESLKDSNFMSEMELTIYDSWFDPIVEMCSTLVPDGFIYLRAQPDTCMDRMKKRSRNEETGVSIEYLQDLHKRHEHWLNSALQKGDAQNHANLMAQEGLAVVNPRYQKLVDDVADRLQRKLKQAYEVPKLPDLIASDVQFLNKNHNKLLHSSIHSLPALVLDCEKDILDLDAQREHAQKVNCYFNYVKDTRKQRFMNKWLDRTKKIRDVPSSVDTAVDGLKKGVAVVPEEWRRELEVHIEYAIAAMKMDANCGSQALVGMS